MGIGLSSMDPQRVWAQPVAVSQMMPYASIPDGIGMASFALARKDGAMRIRFTGAGGLSTQINGRGFVSVALSGAGAIAINANLLASIAAALSGSGNLSAGLGGRGIIAVAMKVAELSQGDIAGAALDTPIEGSITLRQAIRLLLAVQTGTSTITDLGGGAATVRFKSADNTKDRIVASMTGSERTTVTKDPT